MNRDVLCLYTGLHVGVYGSGPRGCGGWVSVVGVRMVVQVCRHTCVLYVPSVCEYGGACECVMGM